MVEKTKAKKKVKFPHGLLIIIGILVLSTALTWIIPGGIYYDADGDGSTESFMWYQDYMAYLGVESGRTINMGPWLMMKMVYLGFLEGSGSGLFIVILAVYGALHVFQKSGAMDAAITVFARRSAASKKTAPIILAMVMIIFAFWGSTGTLSFEEIGGFIPIFLGLSIALGYDAIVASAVCVCALGYGFSAGMWNPFNVGMAQSIAGIDMFSGTGIRLILLAATLGTLIWWTLRYAKKVKANPGSSLVYGIDYSRYTLTEEQLQTRFTWRHILSFVALVATIIATILLVYNAEADTTYTISALNAAQPKNTVGFGYFVICFIIFTAVVILINGMNPSDGVRHFIKGAEGAMLPIICIGFAYGISYVIGYGFLKGTIVYSVSTLIGNAGAFVGAAGMLIMQTLINFLVPSGSGQAALTMPIMSGIANQVGLSQQIAVLCFQCGDGFSNLLWPTAAAVLASEYAGIPLNKYYRWFLPIFGITLLISYIVISIAIVAGI